MSLNYNRDIEVLRGIAVCLVVVHHMDFNLHYFQTRFFYEHFNGWTGVDLFFVISGYVIASSLFPQLDATVTKEETKRTILSFWLRRAFRLLPSAWFWLAAILVLQITFNSSNAFLSLESNLWATLYGVLQIANLRFAEAWGHFEYGASFHYWSLSLEEQFYVILPVAAVLLKRRYLPWALFAVALIQLGIERTPHLMAFRTDALCFGVLLYFVQAHFAFLQRSNHTSVAERIVLSVVFLLALALLVTAGTKMPQLFSLRMTQVTLAATVIVAIAAYRQGIVSNLVFLPTVWEWLGRRSYAIYLIHLPAFFINRELFFRLGLPGADNIALLICTTVLTTLLLSQLNYRYLETPFRNRGKRLARQMRDGKPMAGLAMRQSE